MERTLKFVGIPVCKVAPFLLEIKKEISVKESSCPFSVLTNFPFQLLLFCGEPINWLIHL